jgi:hypothetical protein
VTQRQITAWLCVLLRRSGVTPAASSVSFSDAMKFDVSGARHEVDLDVVEVPRRIRLAQDRARDVGRDLARQLRAVARAEERHLHPVRSGGERRLGRHRAVFGHERRAPHLRARRADEIEVRIDFRDVAGDVRAERHRVILLVDERIERRLDVVGARARDARCGDARNARGDRGALEADGRDPDVRADGAGVDGR